MNRSVRSVFRQRGTIAENKVIRGVIVEISKQSSGKSNDIITQVEDIVSHTTALLEQSSKANTESHLKLSLLNLSYLNVTTTLENRVVHIGKICRDINSIQQYIKRVTRCPQLKQLDKYST